MHHIKPTPADLMQRMTEPLSPSWLSSALGVSSQTVHRWKHGEHVTEERLTEVAIALRRLLPEHKELAAPDWERLERTVYAIARHLKVAIPDAQEQAARKVDARLGLGPHERTRAAPSVGLDNVPADVSPSSRRQAPKP